MSSYTNTFVILGKTASIDVNDRGNHVCIDLDDLIITDASGEIGFWEGFNRDASRALCKGAARQSALDKYAREFVESEIVEALRFAQQQVAALEAA